MKKISKKLILFLAACFILLSFAVTHIPFSILFRINIDDITDVECVAWNENDSLDIFKNNYAYKTYRPYIGEIGSTAHMNIELLNNEGQISEFTDLGCLGLINYKGMIFQERGCYADEGIKHVINTISSSFVYLLPFYIAIILFIVGRLVLRKR